MSKKGQKETGTTSGGYEADRSESEDEEKEGEGEKIHDENEDLFKDMMGRSWVGGSGGRPEYKELRKIMTICSR